MAGFGQTEKENTKPAIRPLVNTGNLSPCFKIAQISDGRCLSRAHERNYNG